MADHTASTRPATFTALQRAVRTWWQAVSGVVAVSVGTALIELLRGADVLSGDFWISVLRMALVAVIAATAAYWAKTKTAQPDNQ
jgi:hypothetical protein